MKKAFVLTLLILAAASAAAAQTYPGRQPFEIGLYGGLSYGANTYTTSYGTTWSKEKLTRVEETTVIETLHKLGLAGGLFATYYFSPNWGVQVAASGMHAATPSTSYFQFAWLWISDVDNLKAREWDDTGSLTVMPFSLNLACRLGEESVKGALSAGLTLFKNSYSAASTFGFGVDLIEYVQVDPTTYTMTQYVDALPLTIEIPKTSWSQIGANVGAALDVEMSPATSLRVDVRYFFCPTKTLTWNIVQGAYDGMFYNKIKNMEFGTALQAEFDGRGRALTMKLNPSFFQFSIGFVMHLGGSKSE